jgi:putative transcription factor
LEELVDMQCELCGMECYCKPAKIDGVKMMLCPNCIKHGQAVEFKPKPTSVGNKPISERIRKPKVKDVYKNMDKELVSNWNDIIKSAREKKGMTREQLGFKIGERTVTISKIENGDLRPSDKVVEKLEKELKIKLIEQVEDIHASLTSSKTKSTLTLGDFIKKEE